MDLIDVCFIFSNGSIYDVGIVFHITISIQWKVPFSIRPDVIIAEKAKIVAFRIKKVPVLREEIGPPFPDLYVFLSHFLIQSSLVVETEPRPSNGLLPIT